MGSGIYRLKDLRDTSTRCNVQTCFESGFKPTNTQTIKRKQKANWSFKY